MRSIILTVICVFFVSGLSNEVAAETSNRVVSIVNDDVITQYELNKRIEEMTGRKSDEIRSMNESKFLETRRQVLDLMIDEKLTQEKIKELEIEVTPSQIDATIEDIKKGNNMTQEDLIKGLQEQGITYEKYREKIKTQLERTRLINYEVKSKILIREEELVEYYNKHQDRYRFEPEVHIAAIFLTPDSIGPEDGYENLEELGQALIKRLKDGEDFELLAKKYSRGPGADEGGDLGKFKISDLAAEMKDVLEEINENEISGPIKKGNGIFILKLIEKKKGGLRPFEEVKDEIQEILYNEEVNKRYATWIKDLRDKTYIKIIF